MPDKRTHDQGLIIAKLMLNMVSAAAKFYFEADAIAPVATDVLLCAAVYIGQSEGKPMKSGKLAVFIGMPRGTVSRKLKELEQTGILIRANGDRWVVAMDAPGVGQRKIKQVMTIKAIILKAAKALSKMDTDALAED